ncbi:MAG: quinolinate synthase NadA [Rhodospirillales bacterium]|jgi:quinolinate synthase|nr:quinolinate synthase [Rhodospirillaceae bacterium]MDP6426409.1 quinolinate synthase NadA [Rhodospirillales bacterium]MDP6645756.1 quinolinate synthase NadA [Rhodospirillales bacterium]MDP6840330.1 quinolinate synthase NadA [Rhodospirillales bacterium]|tara:strand:+ start:903 stop:1916 length:1014 start_codon:yes stop_codon:yes gene_type:complete
MIDTVFDAESGALTADDLDPLIDLEAEISRVRREKNAVILAHYYQDPDIQDIADFVGDSLDLSRKAAETDADIIAFCGVKFMAEGAKILNPGKTVVLPDREAGCSLEDSCQPDDFKAFRDAHPDHTAITYINCSAEVKALSDIIVTSSNAAAIIDQIPKDQPILFAPDKHLGAFLRRKTGRDMTLWPGTCIVHEQFNERELVKLATRHPDAKITAHPECPESILRHADHIGSTRSILEFVTTENASEFIVATEQHLMHQMQKAAPDRTFIAAPGADGGCDCANCPFMALNSLEKLYLAMVNEAPRIEIPEDLRTGALAPLQRMLDMSPLKPPARNAA